jgi:heptosyltransferase II
MKILIELPSWLGDTVMATPAIENLVSFFKDPEVTLIGSDIAIESIKNHPKVTKTYVLEKNYFDLYKAARSFEEFDVFISFRSSMRSTFIKFFISCKSKYQFNKNIYKSGHQVEKYNDFINSSFKINTIAGKLVLHNESKKKNKKNNKNKLLGINPGASYGSSKRWYPNEFAKVACNLSDRYDIIIFGGANEINIAADIERYLIKKGIKNYKNLANKTSVAELISQINKIDLLITGDSGPMHLSAALNIPTISIFGPTNHHETSQWMNKKNIVVKKNLDCQPCMKRTCHLKHHNCMKLIEASDVLEAVNRLN